MERCEKCKHWRQTEEEVNSEDGTCHAMPGVVHIKGYNICRYFEDKTLRKKVIDHAAD